MATHLVINKQHSLFPEQIGLLQNYGDIKFINIPSTGISKTDMDKFEYDNNLLTGDTIIFASPIPYLLKKLASELVDVPDMSVVQDLKYNVLVFHNDKRDKKEFPNGKIVNVVSETGWELV